MGKRMGWVSDMLNNNFYVYKEKVDISFPLKMVIPAIGMCAIQFKKLVQELFSVILETSLGIREGKSTNFVNQETN